METFTISQDIFTSASTLLSEYLDDINLYNQVLKHGCHCSFLDSTSDKSVLGGSLAIDELDSICKQWYGCRMCNQKYNGGSCYDQNLDNAQYLIEINNGVANCPTGGSDCEHDSCLIDAYYVSEIKNYLNTNPGFQGFLPWLDEITTVCISGSFQGTTEKHCSGTVPHLEVTNGPLVVANSAPSAPTYSDRPSIIVPVYIYPWQVWGGPLVQAYFDIRDTLAAYPNVDHYIIINPNNGADTVSVPNTAWQQVLDLYAPYANAKLIGYVPTNYGQFNGNDKLQTAQTIINGYFTNNWNVEGIFFDETGNKDEETLGDNVSFNNYTALVNQMKNFDANFIAVFNMGTKLQTFSPWNEWTNNWYDLCDICVTYENNVWHTNLTPPSSAAENYSREKFSAIVRNIPVSQQENHLDLAWNQYFGQVFISSTADYHSNLGK